MKPIGIDELRARIADAWTNEDAKKLAEAMVRATELAQEEARTGVATKADLANLCTQRNKEMADLRTKLQRTFGSKPLSSLLP